MKEGEGIKKWLAVVIIILIVVILLLFVIFLPFLIPGVKSKTLVLTELRVDLQIGNPQATLTLPTDLAKLYPRAKVDLLAPPYLTKTGVSLMAVRDLETILGAQVNWWPKNKNIQVIIPPNIIQKNQVVLILTPEDYILNNNLSFVPIRLLSKLLSASEITWFPQNKGIRLSWSRNFAP